LVLEDLGVATKNDQSKVLFDKFIVFWEEEVSKASVGKRDPSLWMALWKTVGYADVFSSVVFYVLYAALSFVPIIILSSLVNYFEGNIKLSKLELWLYAGGMFVLPMLSSILAAKSNIIVVHMAIRFRNALVTAIFRKALKLSPDSRQQQSSGKIINLFANDTRQIQSFLYIFNNVLVAPFQIAITVYLIYLQVGVSTFVGLGYMILISPLNAIIFGKLNSIRKLKVEQSDIRVKLMSEILNGIRVIKYYAWEEPFKEKIEAIRMIEVMRICMICCYVYSYLIY
jgi:ABC-type multidrug transport system fused ATPase/permease subunit